MSHKCHSRHNAAHQISAGLRSYLGFGQPAGTAGQAHRKDRALARLARHGHIAAHHARELARERKAEPGAPVAARRERIGLGEILEQLRLLLGGDPDDGVGD
jgi:hypothetical protein